MWTREELKSNAKSVLSKYYWWGILALLINSVISGIISTPFLIMDGFRKIASQTDIIYNSDVYTYQNTFFKDLFYSFFNIPNIIISIFVALPLTVGLCYFFLNLRQNKKDISDIFISLKNQNYLYIVGAMSWQYLFTVLWTLLFIIPGIVKGIAYSMTPYILADNPKIGYKRALKLSMAMTYGHKADIFVLWLSFIGWFLLGILACCGIGVFFLIPYIQATEAELYVELRGIAIGKGYCTAEELNLVRVEI